MGDSSRAAGRSWVTSGFALSANRLTRRVVVRDSRRKVGSTRNVSASSASRLAVVLKTRFELTTRSRSWPWRSVSASNTAPVSRTSARVEPLWRRRTASTVRVSSANGARLPSASLRYLPLAETARPCWSSQLEKSRRVLASKVRRISSSSTVSAT